MAVKGSVFVLGSGAAGQGAARSLSALGWDVTLADGGKIGGTCLWHGCMPKKALYHAARLRRESAAAETFGLGVCDSAYDWQAVLAWKWHSQETYAGDQESILAKAGVRLINANAQFVSPDEIECDSQRFTPDHVIIATGSRSVVLPIPGAELADTSDDALGYPAPPASLLIVGGGFIGMEFAAIYSSFGTRVTLITSAPRPLEMLDADTSAVAVKRLERAGVRFHTHCRLTAIEGSPGDLTVHFT
ncbi:MAG: FAD-dependent oxidoreductase, partial [Coriobacteriia bacterium]|nr:FAD-dependent oxidoreductase [Coriobacteriia bacterium]